MADSWVSGFAMNQVCYCKESKEYVKITNGTCTLDHSNPENYNAAHDAHAAKSGQRGCLYAPSEAIALRCTGITDKGEPIVAYTYRKVRAEDLSVSVSSIVFPDLTKIKKRLFAGRV